MILLWGVSGDRPLALVHQALQRHGAPVLFLDQSAFLETELELSFSPQVRGTLRVSGKWVELANITAAYIRPHDLRLLPEIRNAEPGGAVRTHAIRLEDALLCWTELASALVVNPPSAMASNGSKPYQSALIRWFGIDVPETLITTDPNAALEFWEKHGSVVYKSVSGVRSIVSRLGSEHSSRLQNIANCPTQFQEYIAGRDFRLHIVGDEFFISEIISDADDYRYAIKTGCRLKIRPGSLPEDVVGRCRALVAFLGLRFSGVDLRRNQDGKWYCFEVNPSPGFSFYEEATGQPISDAVARLLINDR
jgi:glutathione synthase/RimK-type ligase-like ATP-grasp enzyme